MARGKRSMTKQRGEPLEGEHKKGKKRIDRGQEYGREGGLGEKGYKEESKERGDKGSRLS